MPNQPRILYSFVLTEATVTDSPWVFSFTLLFLFTLSLDCLLPLELAFHIKQVVVRVIPLVQSNASWPKEIPTIQALLGERQITNLRFGTTTICSHWKVNTWYRLCSSCYSCSWFLEVEAFGIVFFSFLFKLENATLTLVYSYSTFLIHKIENLRSKINETIVVKYYSVELSIKKAT